MMLVPQAKPWRPYERLRARNDFDDLARDRRLPDLVHVQRQARDHVGRVLGRRVHRGHLRGEERRVRLEQRAIDLHLDVARQQLVENLLRRRLVEIVDLRSSPRAHARPAPSTSPRAIGSS